MSLVSIVGYYMTMNWNNAKTEMTNSVKKVTKNLGALWSVAKENGKINWRVYGDYMNGFVQVEKNVIAMAIIDSDGNVRASAINDKVLKQYYKNVKTGNDKNEAVKAILEQKLNDSYKVEGYLRIVDKQEVEKAKAAKNEKPVKGFLKKDSKVDTKQPEQAKPAGPAKLVVKYTMWGAYMTQNWMVVNTSILAVVILVFGWFGAWYLAKFISTNFNIIVAGMRKVAEGNLDVEVNVKSNDEVGVLADDFNRMIVELKQKVRIKDAFESVADGLKDMDDIKKAYKTLTYQEMTDKMMKGYAPIAKPDENRTIFIFIDTSSFLNFSYELMSEELKTIIEKFIEKVSMTALEYQGSVFKVTDKYILLSFGYPFKHKDDMKRAIISTVEIRKELVQLVKSKLTLGYAVEDFSVNFMMIGGNVTRNFVDKLTNEKYRVIVDYLNFASKYGEKKQYSTDIYATSDVADGTSQLAMFDMVDTVVMPEGGSIELMKLKGTKF
jgi:HAMP domain-containing protein